MTDHRVATLDEWLAARRELLAEEKDFTRLRDKLSAKRRAMPWVKMDKDYRFDGPEGQNLALADLFGGRRQLIVYHFMFAPDWEKPCKSCSFWADGYNGVTQHLAHRDTRLVAVSRARLAKLEATAKRLGWSFAWYSSGEGAFNYDFHVSFHPEQVADGTTLQFRPDPDQDVRPARHQRFHQEAGRRLYPPTRPMRGLDMLNPAYQLLDITALGRHEDDLPFPMAWVRLHDDTG